ncbi:MAG: formimidoylglutamate deiminase [Robiginitomaculum sp.]|nr:MAG: formimidoylglutamate deiminase [Robiginitomaculum sp.]
MTDLHFKSALLSSGWQDDIAVSLDNNGLITSLDTQSSTQASTQSSTLSSTSAHNGFAIAGMPNAHSHAFQRAMAGLAEFSTNPTDSFWTWRETMYKFSQIITPDDLYAIAKYLYMEMLEAGYTSVAEFHYLHHQLNGVAYPNPVQMSMSIAAAAADTGIALTLLPVLYMRGGFDDRPLNQQQRRFQHDVAQYLETVMSVESLGIHTGIAFHSLRAVPPEAMMRVLQDDVVQEHADIPIHIHIAEQTAEIDDCLAHTGERPVTWLLDNFKIGANWILVHATHMTQAETRALAHTGAVAVICPTTEGNLGDGLFPLPVWDQNEGRIAIGSDSHISVDPYEELRWLEYGQRLSHRRRTIYANDKNQHTGSRLYQSALRGGAQSVGRQCGEIAVGNMADIVVLRDDIPAIALADPKHRLDALIFNPTSKPVKGVFVGGKCVVKDGMHKNHDHIKQEYFATLKKLLDRF